MRLRFAHHLHNFRERAFTGAARHLNLDRAAAIDRTGKYPALRINHIGLGACGDHVGYRYLVDRDAFAGNGRLVDSTRSLQDEAVGGQALVRTHDDDVADHHLFDVDFTGRPIAAHRCGLRCELRQGFNCLLGTAHGIMLQRVSETEQEQK